MEMSGLQNSSNPTRIYYVSVVGMSVLFKVSDISSQGALGINDKNVHGRWTVGISILTCDEEVYTESSWFT